MRVQKLNRPGDVSDWVSAAAALRRRVSDLFGAGPAEHVVLAPGILIGLQVLLPGLGVRRICLSDREYYGRAHFPAQEMCSPALEDLVECAAGARPDAVLASLVTWRGEEIPIARLFRRIRAQCGRRAPLLIADCTHAGAVGFPELGKLGADMVCGDTGKWILPPGRESRIAFLWFRTEALARAARRAFEPFFLAAGSRDGFLYSRWLDPAEVLSVEDWYRRRRLGRPDLERRHRANLRLAARLAGRFGVTPAEGNSILRLAAGSPAVSLLAKLESLGLVWRLPDGTIRIQCRADVR